MRTSASPRRFTIGELARVAGVGVETIRFYERRGLIERPVRPPQGFRTYPRGALARLAFVREAQELGFTLREVRDLMALNAAPGTDCAAVRGRAAAKLGQIEARMARFARMRETLRALCSRAARAAASSRNARLSRRCPRPRASRVMAATQSAAQGGLP